MPRLCRSRQAAQGMRKLRFFRCKYGPNFEIFHYEAPNQNLLQPKNSDIGGHHLAFYVDDFNAAVEYLSAKGVKLLGEPTTSQFELVSFPHGKGYEKDTTSRLWHPAYPAS